MKIDSGLRIAPLSFANSRRPAFLLLNLLDDSQRVVTRHQRNVLVSAHVSEKWNELMRIRQSVSPDVRLHHFHQFWSVQGLVFPRNFYVKYENGLVGRASV